MEENLKQLLLKDICARLSYGTEISCVDGTSGMITSISIVPHGTFVTVYFNRDNVEDISLEDIKPYLRPLSSMTEEEKKEFQACHCVYELHPDFQPMMCNLTNELNMFDWLNKKMFDYRGLIPMGLALEAKEGMYK